MGSFESLGFPPLTPSDYPPCGVGVSSGLCTKQRKYHHKRFCSGSLIPNSLYRNSRWIFKGKACIPAFFKAVLFQHWIHPTRVRDRGSDGQNV